MIRSLWSCEGRGRAASRRGNAGCKFVDPNVAMQMPLADAARSTQKVARALPEALQRVGVDFAHAVAVFCSRPSSVSSPVYAFHSSMWTRLPGSVIVLTHS
jgi:hypothetical protein